MKSLAVAVLLLLVGAAVSQDLPRLDSAEANPSHKPAFLIVCDSDPSKIVVLDGTGKWIADVKTADLTIRSGKPCQLRCEVYSGNIRPSQPQILTWDLAQLQSVNTAEFQTMIDNLQTDPTYVKNSRTAPPTPPAAKKGN